jgi:AraC-like DNA-binding protein
MVAGMDSPGIALILPDRGPGLQVDHPYTEWYESTTFMGTPDFVWSSAALPGVAIAGRFPMPIQGFSHRYGGATHALHVYDYAAAMRLCGSEIQLRPGDLTISPAGEETRYDLVRPGQHWCIHFHPAAQAGEPISIPVHLALGALKPRVVDAIQRIAGLMAAPTEEAAFSRPAASAALLELLLSLAAHAARSGHRERAPKARGAAEHAAALLDASPADPPAAGEIARRVGLSPNWLSRAFRARYGTTMARYVLSSRMTMAQHLLRTTDLPVGNIARSLGFHDVQHFNKRFRRVAGCSPSSFRLRGGVRR